MNRLKLTISVVSLSCLFLLVFATQVNAVPSSIAVSSASTQPNLKQAITNTLRSNPNFSLSNIQVIVDNDVIQLYGSAKNGYQRAIAQKFIENIPGVRIVENKMNITTQL